jgi:hypothetical protein
MKYTLICLICVLVLWPPTRSFAQNGLGTQRDTFPLLQFQTQLPPDLDGGDSATEVGPHSIVLQNTSNGVMHFSAGGINFDIGAKSAKKIDLPNGMSNLGLFYSIEGQTKQLTVTGGHSYALYFDVQNRQIVSQQR